MASRKQASRISSFCFVLLAALFPPFVLRVDGFSSYYRTTSNKILHRHHGSKDRRRVTVVLGVVATPAKRSVAATNQRMEELLEAEVGLYQRGENPITTLTWFSGNFEVAQAILCGRLAKILDANPWLGGSLVQDSLPGGKVYLAYDQNIKLNPRDFFFTVKNQQSSVARTTPLDQLAKKTKEWTLKDGPGQRLFRVSVVPCSNNSNAHFAVIVALSHIIADGHTYYKILSMLFSKDDDTIIPLIERRISTTGQQQADAMGKANYDAFANPIMGVFLSFALGVLRAKTIGPANECIYALVDPDKMSRYKTQAVKQGYGGDDVGFVSTNDVLTSWFMQNSNTGAGVMALNWRNRLSGHTDRHAGNYEGVVAYRRPDLAWPSLIRKSLQQGYRRTVTTDQPLSGLREAITRPSLSIVTNWASFAKPNVIDGCEEELHIPLYDAVPLVPTGSAILIIFRSGPKGLGIYMVGTPATLRGLGYCRRQFNKRPPFLSTESLI